jgi:hypothetical protein
MIQPVRVSAWALGEYRIEFPISWEQGSGIKVNNQHINVPTGRGGATPTEDAIASRDVSAQALLGLARDIIDLVAKSEAAAAMANAESADRHAVNARAAANLAATIERSRGAL